MARRFAEFSWTGRCTHKRVPRLIKWLVKKRQSCLFEAGRFRVGWVLACTPSWVLVPKCPTESSRC
ncbi:hypothetical protein RSAG8_11317, partial [Rhizoctonia solani AG-8 WAC10335]